MKFKEKLPKRSQFREKILESGIKVVLGKDEKSNEELVKGFIGKKNKILHTVDSGSPFGVITDLKPNKADVYQSAVLVARYSHDWRDNKEDVKVNVFTGENVYKIKLMKIGTFGVKKSRTIVVKKKDILRLK